MLNLMVRVFAYHEFGRTWLKLASFELFKWDYLMVVSWCQYFNGVLHIGISINSPFVPFSLPFYAPLVHKFDLIVPLCSKFWMSL